MGIKTKAPAKRRRWKSEPGIIVAAAAAAAAALGIGSYIGTGRAASQDGKSGREADVLAASGITFSDTRTFNFEIDFLKETKLYVEKVYLVGGDSVKAGDRCVKFTRESIAGARLELESAALAADLSYQNAVISDGEGRLQAKYDYDMAILSARYAQQVYDDDIAQLEADYARAASSYEEAQREYDEYYEMAKNNSFYEKYDIADLKKAYEEASALYADKKTGQEVTDEELNTAMHEDTGAQDAANERNWIVKTVLLLKQEAAEAEEKYTSALEAYEDEIACAELNLQKLFGRLETAREDYSDAEGARQKQGLAAKAAYEMSVARGEMAKADYDTQLVRLGDTLASLKDAKEEADANLALFESLVGDGYLYAGEKGIVLTSGAQEGRSLPGGSMVFAYINPEQISVSVTLGRDDIARLDVGDTAAVSIPGCGEYGGTVRTISPLSLSGSGAFASYDVTVDLHGDVGGIATGMVAGVVFGGEKTGVSGNTMGSVAGNGAYGTEDAKKFRIIEQICGLDVPAKGGSGGKYPEVCEVYVAAGQRVQEGDRIYQLTSGSVDPVRKALTYKKNEAQAALASAKAGYRIGILEAELSRDKTLLDASLAQTSYDTAVARLTNDIYVKSLEIQQLLNDIYKLQCGLTGDDYMEERLDVLGAYEDAVEGVKAAGGSFVTNKVGAAQDFLSARERYEQFFDRTDTSNRQIQDKIGEVHGLDAEIVYSRELLEKGLLAEAQKLEASNVSGLAAPEEYQSSLESCENALARAEREYAEAKEELEAFEKFIGDGTIRAEGSGIVTKTGYGVGDCLEYGGVLIVFARADDNGGNDE